MNESSLLLLFVWHGAGWLYFSDTVCEWMGQLNGRHLTRGNLFVLFSLSLSLDSCNVLSSLSLDYLCLESQLDVSSSFFFVFFLFWGCPHTVLRRCSRPHHPTIIYHLSITSPDVSFLRCHLWSGRLFLPDTMWVGEWVGYLWQDSAADKRGICRVSVN